MSRILQLRGDTSYQLQTLKEACEMEGSRMVSLRADELLAFILVFSEAPEGVEIVVSADLQTQVGDRDAKIVELEGLLAAANGEVESLKAKLLDADQRIVLYVRAELQAAEKILALTNDVALLKVNRSKIDKELEELKAKLDVEGNAVVDIANERDELRSKINTAEESVATLNLELERRNKELVDQLALFGESQKNAGDLKAKLSLAEKATIDLAAERDHLATTLKEEAQKWGKMYDERDAKITELEAKLAPFQAALAAAAPKPADPPAETKLPAS